MDAERWAIRIGDHVFTIKLNTRGNRYDSAKTDE
jgi:hypothetical protein